MTCLKKSSKLQTQVLKMSNGHEELDKNSNADRSNNEKMPLLSDPAHEEVLQLKRLLVAVKQHYEKHLQELRLQLQAEQERCLLIRKELEKVQTAFSERELQHQEELQALCKQQAALKERIKNGEASLEAGGLKSSKPGEDSLNRGSESEFAQLRSQITLLTKKNEQLEREIASKEYESRREIDQLHQLLQEHKLRDEDSETASSAIASRHLQRELEMIKSILAEGVKESKALESHFNEVLNEKIHDLEAKKRELEETIQSKETDLKESLHQRQELQSRVEALAVLLKEKETVQAKCEQLEEDWKALHEKLDEANEARIELSAYLADLESEASREQNRVEELERIVLELQQENDKLREETAQSKDLLEESESRLKTAQQHLAKKVKEAALLTHELEEQQIRLSDCLQEIEVRKEEAVQLQASLDLHQKDEKKLQEQLHDVLRGAENQIVKWEEKYFQMYDKWQESEKRVENLKRVEEKHLQMQNLLANLGHFMSNPLPASSPIPIADQESEPPLSSFDAAKSEENWPEAEPSEIKYNLFGMRQTHS